MPETPEQQLELFPEPIVISDMTTLRRISLSRDRMRISIESLLCLGEQMIIRSPFSIATGVSDHTSLIEIQGILVGRVNEMNDDENRRYRFLLAAAMQFAPKKK